MAVEGGETAEREQQLFGAKLMSKSLENNNLAQQKFRNAVGKERLWLDRSDDLPPWGVCLQTPHGNVSEVATCEN